MVAGELFWCSTWSGEVRPRLLPVRPPSLHVLLQSALNRFDRHAGLWDPPQNSELLE